MIAAHQHTCMYRFLLSWALLNECGESAGTHPSKGDKRKREGPVR